MDQFNEVQDNFLVPVFVSVIVDLQIDIVLLLRSAERRVQTLSISSGHFGAYLTT